MNKQISNLVLKLKLQFVLFYVLTISMFVLGEFNYLSFRESFSYKSVFWFETIEIILTTITIPVSLKFFPWFVDHKISQYSLSKAIVKYYLYSLYRLLFIFLPIYLGVYVYYSTLSSKGIFCACIGLCASLFCIPEKKRIMQDLSLDENHE